MSALASYLAIYALIALNVDRVLLVYGGFSFNFVYIVHEPNNGLVPKTLITKNLSNMSPIFLFP